MEGRVTSDRWLLGALWEAFAGARAICRAKRRHRVDRSPQRAFSRHGEADDRARSGARARWCSMLRVARPEYLRWALSLALTALAVAAPHCVAPPPRAHGSQLLTVRSGVE
jgi:hypothetical protein